MLKAQRQRALMGVLKAHEYASFHELATSFGVSAMTVRRDALRLQQEGLLRIIAGGVTCVPPPLPTTSADYSGMAEHLGPGAVVFCSAGVDVAALLDVCPRAFGITLVTHDLRVPEALCHDPRIADIIAVGGLVDRSRSLSTGAPAATVIALLCLHLAVLVPEAHHSLEWAKEDSALLDAVLVNADHVYWLGKDQPGSTTMPSSSATR